MITLFTTLRPNAPPFDLIQRNALMSWRAILPDAQILVIGDDEGAEELAAVVGAEFIPDVMRDGRKPYVSEVFRKCEEHAKFDVRCYVNGDIVLPHSFAKMVSHTPDVPAPWLMVGQRWDWDNPKRLEFREKGWEMSIWRNRMTPHARTGEDYFLFSPGVFKSDDIPEFVLGNMAWDGWLMWYALHVSRAVVIDASEAVFAVHQNHPEKVRFADPDCQRNYALAGKKLARLDDCTHKMTKDYEVVSNASNAT